MDFIFQFTILFKEFRVILYFVNRPLKNMHSNHTGNYKYLQLAKKNHIRISNILKEINVHVLESKSIRTQKDNVFANIQMFSANIQMFSANV